MGQRLAKLYEYADKNGGLTVKMRIAMKTGVPSNKALETPDSDEIINKARMVIKEATGKEAPTV